MSPTLPSWTARAVAGLAALAAVLASCARGGAPAVKAPPTLVPRSATSVGVVDLAGLAANALLRDDFLAGYRDRALARIGLRVDDAQKVTGPVQVFRLASGALGAFMPGYRHAGAPAANHRGDALLATGRADEVAANVPGGCLLGQTAAVTAALDVLRGRGPWLERSMLDELLERGADFRSIRLATLDAAQLIALAPSAPPAAVTALARGGAVYLTLDGSRLTARIDVRCADEPTASAIADWAEAERRQYRDKVAGFREAAGLFGAALEPAVKALDAIRVTRAGTRASILLDHDLRPIFSSGLLGILKTMQMFSR